MSTVTVDADIREDDPPDDVLKGVASDELTGWGRGLSHDDQDEPIFPDPHTEQGLPDGWGIHAEMATQFDSLDTDWLLVRRATGGWLLVRHERDLSRTALRGAAVALGGLYADVQRVASPNLHGVYPTLAGWLRALIVDAYDPSDEIEVAARVMVALGGPVIVTPKALA